MKGTETLPTHPLGAKVLSGLRKGPKGLELDPQSLKDVKDALSTIPEAQLPSAIMTLMVVAAKLDKDEKSPEAGRAVLSVVMTANARLAAYLQSGNSPIAELAARKRNAFRKLTGGPKSPVAKLHEAGKTRAPGLKSASQLFPTHVR